MTAPPQKMFLVPITLTTDMYELFLVLAHSSKIVIVVTNDPLQLLLCLSYQVVYYLTTLYQIQPLSGSVTMAWHVLRLRMVEWPLIWRVAANILNKQSRTADKGWSSSLGVGRGADASPWKPMSSNIHKARCFLWRQNNPEVNYSPTWISGGECF